MRKKLAAGNWKMNGTSASLGEVEALVAAGGRSNCEVLLCPPATLIDRVKTRAAGSDLLIGGQDCHREASGAHTGEVSAAMLADTGATHVILGHSERRSDHGDADDLVRARSEAAIGAGLVVVVCVGETEADRAGGDTLPVVGLQLANSLPDVATAENTVVAYEPVWAIGTGRTPSSA